MSRRNKIDVEQIGWNEQIKEDILVSGSVIVTGSIKISGLGSDSSVILVGPDNDITASDVLHIDEVNTRIGINTNDPKYLLDIKTNNGGIRLGNTTNSGEKSSNIHFTELASSDGLNAYGFSLNYNATDNAFNIKRHNNNTSGVSMVNFSRAFGNVQMGDVDPSRFGGAGVPKLWVNADVNDRGIIRCSQHSADSDPPQFEISKARGTMESPAAVQSLDYIAQLRAMGHDGTNFQISSDLLWIASDDFTSTSRPSTLTIRTVPSGSTTPVERMRVTHDGNVGIGTTSPGAQLEVSNDAIISGSLSFEDYMILSVTADNTDIQTGTGQMTFRAPFAMELYQIPRASLSTASTSGAVTVDINSGGTTIFGTNLTIDANETTSTTAATAAVLSTTSIADDTQITVDVDGAGTGARGLKITLYYRRII